MSNTSNNAVVEIAAFSVERALRGARGSIAALVVQPIAWAVSGDRPDAGDVVIYGGSVAGAFAGAVLAAPVTAVGFIKGLLDDNTAERVEAARRDEPQPVRGGIKHVSAFSFTAGSNQNQAAEIARKGGVAWQHPNGVYLYIEDSAERLICDYVPAAFSHIYRPLIPIQMNGDEVLMTTSHP